MQGSERKELRCFCRRQPLLATYGLDNSGRLFIHIRVYKQRRLFGEVLAFGETHIKCRECLRWQKVVIKQPGTAELVAHEITEEIIAPSTNGGLVADDASRNLG